MTRFSWLAISVIFILGLLSSPGEALGVQQKIRLDVPGVT